MDRWWNKWSIGKRKGKIACCFVGMTLLYSRPTNDFFDQAFMVSLAEIFAAHSRTLFADANSARRCPLLRSFGKFTCQLSLKKKTWLKRLWASTNRVNISRIITAQVSSGGHHLQQKMKDAKMRWKINVYIYICIAAMAWLIELLSSSYLLLIALLSSNNKIRSNSSF